MNTSKIIQFWNQIRKGLIETIEKFSDEELNYVPFEGGYSVRQIMLHIAQEEYGEVQYGITRKLDAFPPPYAQDSYPTIDSIMGLLAKVHDDTGKFLENLTDQDLNKETEAGWGGTYSLIDMIWHVM